MITTDCRYCVDEGAKCVPLICDFPDGKRIVGFLHYRIQVVFQHYKEDDKVWDYSDFLLGEAEGGGKLGTFRVSVDDKELMPLAGILDAP